MHLLDQQRSLRMALLSATCPSDLLATGRTPIAPRFAIYANAYRGRLIAALRDNYPVTSTVLGDEAFDELGEAFLSAHPSRTPSIRWFGEALHDFVTRQPERVPHPALADLIRMEWALRHALDAADQAPVSLQALAACPPERWPFLRFSLHPSVTLLPLAWHVEPLWQQLQRHPASETPPPEHSAHDLLVWRQAMTVRYRTLSAVEAVLLRALQRGETLASACDCAFGGTPADEGACALLSVLAQLVGDGVLADEGLV